MSTAKRQEQSEESVRRVVERHIEQRDIKLGEPDAITVLVGELNEQVGDLFDIVSEGEALDDALGELREAEEAFAEAEEDGDEDTVAEATEECERAAVEVAGQHDMARVLCYNMQIGLYESEDMALRGYEISRSNE